MAGPGAADAAGGATARRARRGRPGARRRRGAGRSGGGRRSAAPGGALHGAVRLTAEVDHAVRIGLAVGVAVRGDDGASGVARVVELPPLVDDAVAVGVALALHQPAVLVVVPGVDLVVEVGLAHLQLDLPVLEDRDLVGPTVAIEVLLAAAHAALVVVVDEGVDGAVHVQVDGPAHLLAVLHHVVDGGLSVALDVDLDGIGRLGVARLVDDVGVALLVAARGRLGLVGLGLGAGAGGHLEEARGEAEHRQAGQGTLDHRSASARTGRTQEPAEAYPDPPAPASRAALNGRRQAAGLPGRSGGKTAQASGPSVNGRKRVRLPQDPIDITRTGI